MTQESREYPARPIVGVGGVVIHEGRVLLVQRARPPLQGHWSIPGGGLEIGETIASGISREVREETGIEVQVREHIGVFERIIRDESGRVQYHYVLVDRLCEVVGGTLMAGGDAANAVWASEEELGEFSLTDTAAQVIRKAFEAARAPRKS